MTLTTLKEEARTNLKGITTKDGFVYKSDVEKYLGTYIDRTYHATKEEVRGIVEEEILVYEIENSRSTAGNPYNYAVQGALSALQGIRAALEDTTTSPTN